MKRFYLSIALAVAALNTQSQIQYLWLDTLCSGDCPGLPPEYTTVQLFAHCTNATDVVTTVYGLNTSPLYITTDCCFYQSPVGANVGSAINCPLCGFFPDLCYDSWVTIGCECSNECSSSTFTLESAGQQWIDIFNTSGCGGSIAIDDAIGGAWFIPPTSADAMAGADLEILLGQFSVCGCLDVLINCQVFPNYTGPGSPDIQQIGLATTTCATCANPGCMDTEAENYDPLAECEPIGACVYCNIQVDNIAFNNPTCGNSSDGSINLDGSGTEGFLQYHLGGTENLSGIFTGLGNGSYTVQLVDEYFEPGNPGNIWLPEGCTLDVEVELNTPAVSFGVSTTSNVSCFNGNDGNASQAVSGGVEQLSVNIKTCGSNVLLEDEFGVVELTEASYDQLPAGNWQWLVTDENGCEYTSNCFAITQPVALSVAALPVDASCAESADGSVCANWLGGVGDVDFTFWADSAEAGIYYEGNCWSDQFLPGPYTLYGIDSNGCEATVDFTVGSPEPIVVTGESTAPICSYSSEGCIVADATGGNGAPFTFYLDAGIPFANGNETCGLAAGTYSVQAVDDTGCAGTSEIIVSAPDEIDPGITIQHVTCYGLDDGAINAQATGGTGPYTYDMGDGPQDSGIFSGFEAGSYTLFVSDMNNCSGTFGFTVGQPDLLELTVELQVQSPLCEGTPINIAIAVVGGTGPFSYSLDGGTAQSSNVFEDVTPGTHDITVSDVNGCGASASVNVPETPSAIEFGTPVIDCAAFDGTCDGSIAVDVTGGTPGYEYSWMDSEGNEVSTAEVPDDLCAGSYTLVVTDANGCEQEYNGDIEVCVGITELPGFSLIEISPNPTNGQFVFQLEGMTEMTIDYSVLDATGNLVLAKTVTANSDEISVTIDLTTCAAGNYLLKLKAGKFESTHKVIKE